MSEGLYTNSQLIDTLIVDLNNMLKNFMSGQFIAACGIANSMGQKLVNLQSGIESDLKSKDDLIAALKKNIRELGGETVDYSIDEFVKEGDSDGSN